MFRTSSSPAFLRASNPHRVLAVAALLLVLSASSALGQATIYLDFDGHSESQYGPAPHRAISLPAFAGTNSQRQEIVERVREDFAPFYVNITTDRPDRIDEGWYRETSFRDPHPGAGQIRVVVGGSPHHISSPTGLAGLATDPIQFQNVVWVSEINAQGTQRSIRDIAKLVSHELGHALGWVARHRPGGSEENWLGHYSAFGVLANPSHDLSSQNKSIITGTTRLGRDIWWRDARVAKSLRVGGDVTNPNDYNYYRQDDIVSLTAAIGLAWDDHPDSPSSGTPLRTALSPPQGSTEVLGEGVIEMNLASAPGPCPPVLAWNNHIFCPPTSSRALRDRLVRAPSTERDFFRFDVPRNGSNSRLWIDVLTEDGQGAADRANLDADIEVWHYDQQRLVWVDVTSSGGRREGPLDLWVAWNTTRTPVGLWAVAVKSAGAYGDLGHYTLSVRGTRGLEVGPPEFVLPQLRQDLIGPELTSPLLARLAALETSKDAVHLLGRLTLLGRRGTLLEEEELAMELGEVHLEELDQLAAFYDRAARVTALSDVLAAFIDWESLEDGGEWFYSELEQAVEHLQWE